VVYAIYLLRQFCKKLAGNGIARSWAVEGQYANAARMRSGYAGDV
jgi:hypothetical protein